MTHRSKINLTNDDSFIKITIGDELILPKKTNDHSPDEFKGNEPVILKEIFVFALPSIVDHDQVVLSVMSTVFEKR